MPLLTDQEVAQLRKDSAPFVYNAYSGDLLSTNEYKKLLAPKDDAKVTGSQNQDDAYFGPSLHALQDTVNGMTEREFIDWITLPAYFNAQNQKILPPKPLGHWAADTVNAHAIPAPSM